MIRRGGCIKPQSVLPGGRSSIDCVLAVVAEVNGAGMAQTWRVWRHTKLDIYYGSMISTSLMARKHPAATDQRRSGNSDPSAFTAKGAKNTKFAR